MQHRRQQGFTLIEAAVAIAVVAILSGIIVPLVVKNLRDSQVARARNDVQVVAAAVASQLKDTGTRPYQGIAGGVVAWGSGTAPNNQAPAGANVAAANTFVAIFATASNNALQNRFGYPNGATINSEFAYKGPYMANDVAQKTDPWGRSYLILGYNATGRTGNTPIYIVCAGPDGSIAAAANWNGGMGPGNGVWNLAAAGSQDDIVVRVN